MKKRLLALALAALMILGLLPTAAGAANDDVGNVLPSIMDLNTGITWSATTKDGTTITQNTYKGKVQVLIFFDISGSCINSNTTLNSLATSDLTTIDSLQIIAIGVPNGSTVTTATADTLTTYLNTKVSKTSDDIVYAWMSNLSTLFSYVNAIGTSTRSFASNIVLGTDGNVRSFWAGNYNADYYSSVLELLGVEGVTGNVDDYLTYTTKITGTADYAAAQEELGILNSYRSGNGLSELTLDTALTEAAMQRAAEIAVYYSHTRPNYTSCFTAISGSFTSARENIAIGQGSVSSVMTAWENSPGHNANILAEENKSVGIGCFTAPSGVKCWVQLFTSSSGTATGTSSANEKAFTVPAARGLLDLSLSATSVELETGGETVLTLKNTNQEFVNTETIAITSATSADTGIATATVNDNGTVTVRGVRGGSTTLAVGLASTAGGAPYTLDVAVSVSAGPLSRDMFTVDESAAFYTGSPITKEISGRDGETALVEGTDYTVAYQNNTEAGTATITITGKGAYSGTLTYTFTIKPVPEVMWLEEAYDDAASFYGDTNDVDKMVRVQKDNKWGIIDTTGNVVIPLEYDDMDMFCLDGLIRVRKDGKWGFVDKTGQVAVPLEYAAAHNFSEGLASVGKADKWGFIDKTGNVVIPLEYDDAGSFAEGLAPVQKGNQWGFIDKTGAVVVPLEYDNAVSFDKGLAPVQKDNKWGFIDRTGNVVIPLELEYDDASLYYDDDLCVVQKDGKWGFIDRTGNVVIPLEYKLVALFCNGLCKVNKDYKYGFIDKAGNVVIPLEYDDARNFSGELIVVQKDGKWGVIDKTGNVVIPFAYDDAHNFSGELIVVQKDGKWGVIDKTGNVVVPFEYGFILYSYLTNVAWVQKDGKWGIMKMPSASAPLTQSMFTVDTAEATYTGRPITKAVSGKDGETTLAEGTDYTVTYENNTNVGTATITITGMGRYTGTLTYTFTIKAQTTTGGGGGGTGGGTVVDPGTGGGTVVDPGTGGTPEPPAPVPASEKFTDVAKGIWYEAGVTFVTDKDLFQGVGEGLFAPGQNMTRAMVATVLARLDGQDTQGGATWYAKALDWAKGQGISDGTQPNANVTREQLVTMLYRYAKPAAVAGDLSGFTDARQVSSWAKAAMEWAVAQGILTGKDGLRLDPGGAATRAEVAIILQRFVEKTQG